VATVLLLYETVTVPLNEPVEVGVGVVDTFISTASLFKSVVTELAKAPVFRYINLS